MAPGSNWGSGRWSNKRRSQGGYEENESHDRYGQRQSGNDRWPSGKDNWHNNADPWQNPSNDPWQSGKAAPPPKARPKPNSSSWQGSSDTWPAQSPFWNDSKESSWKGKRHDQGTENRWGGDTTQESNSKNEWHWGKESSKQWSKEHPTETSWEQKSSPFGQQKSNPFEEQKPSPFLAALQQQSVAQSVAKVADDKREEVKDDGEDECNDEEEEGEWHEGDEDEEDGQWDEEDEDEDEDDDEDEDEVEQKGGKKATFEKESEATSKVNAPVKLVKSTETITVDDDDDDDHKQDADKHLEVADVSSEQPEEDRVPESPVEEGPSHSFVPDEQAAHAAQDVRKFLKQPDRVGAPTCESRERGVVGSLDVMCSQKEMKERSEQRQLDSLEWADGSTPSQPILDPAAACKKYQRSAADRIYHAEDIRTLPALARTLSYLFTSVIGKDERTEEIDFWKVYSFLRDRTRAVRVDLHLQQPWSTTTKIYIVAHEICLRFEILSMCLLSSDEDCLKKYDEKMAHKACSQVMEPLLNAYQQVRACNSPDPSVYASPMEPAMRRYAILLLLVGGEESKVFEHLAKIPRDMVTHPAVKWAVEVVSAYAIGNYSRFLRLYYEADLLSATIISPLTNLARQRILWLLLRCSVPLRRDKLPLEDLRRRLAFRDARTTEHFLTFHGLEVIELGTGSKLVQLPSYNAKQGSWDVMHDGKSQAAFNKHLGQHYMPTRCEFERRPDGNLRAKYAGLKCDRAAIAFGAIDNLSSTPVSAASTSELLPMRPSLPTAVAAAPFTANHVENGSSSAAIPIPKAANLVGADPVVASPFGTSVPKATSPFVAGNIFSQSTGSSNLEKPNPFSASGGAPSLFSAASETDIFKAPKLAPPSPFFGDQANDQQESTKPSNEPVDGLFKEKLQNESVAKLGDAKQVDLEHEEKPEKSTAVTPSPFSDILNKKRNAETVLKERDLVDATLPTEVSRSVSSTMRPLALPTKDALSAGVQSHEQAHTPTSSSLFGTNLFTSSVQPAQGDDAIPLADGAKSSTSPPSPAARKTHGSRHDVDVHFLKKPDLGLVSGLIEAKKHHLEVAEWDELSGGQGTAVVTTRDHDIVYLFRASRVFAAWRQVCRDANVWSIWAKATEQKRRRMSVSISQTQEFRGIRLAAEPRVSKGPEWGIPYKYILSEDGLDAERDEQRLKQHQESDSRVARHSDHLVFIFRVARVFAAWVHVCHEMRVWWIWAGTTQRKRRRLSAPKLELPLVRPRAVASVATKANWVLENFLVDPEKDGRAATHCALAHYAHRWSSLDNPRAVLRPFGLAQANKEASSEAAEETATEPKVEEDTRGKASKEAALTAKENYPRKAEIGDDAPQSAAPSPVSEQLVSAERQQEGPAATRATSQQPPVQKRRSKFLDILRRDAAWTESLLRGAALLAADVPV